MPKRTLAADYTIPQALEADLRREDEKSYVDTPQLNNTLKQGRYQDRRYDRKIDMQMDRIETYRDRMEVNDLEREEKRVQGILDEHNGAPKMILPRQRKIRWDVTPEQYEAQKKEEEEEAGNAKDDQFSDQEKALIANVPIIGGVPLTDEVLDIIFPSGYVAVKPPKDYKQDKSIAVDIRGDAGYYIPPSDGQQDRKRALESLPPKELADGLEYFKEEDMKHFGKLTEAGTETTAEERKDTQAMKLILKIKNGNPQVRKKSMRQISENATYFGPKVLFSKILPIIVEPNLEDHERHVLVKVIGRILQRLGPSVRPFTFKIVVLISPLLIEEDFTTRMEAREIIVTLTKAVGLANMISTVRPDLDHVDEYVRNLASRVFAIVAYTSGLAQFLPFLRAVIKSKKNWMARHTGMKIVQQLCIILGGGNGAAILPYLSQLVNAITPGLTDENLSVRSITALTLAQLAENVKPYGIEYFEPALEPAWLGLRKHRGKGLASFLRCISSIIALMTFDPNYEEYSNYYTKEIMRIIVREFNSPDEDMRKSILRIMIALPLSRQLIPKYNTEIIAPFLKFFWNRKTASDSKTLGRFVIDATCLLATKFDFLDMLENIVVYTKDENENLRIMSMGAISKMITSDPGELLGIDSQLEVQLVDGVLYAFQEQSVQPRVYLESFGAVALALGSRLRPHINVITSTILFRLKNKLPEIREQASDLITIIAPVIKECSDGDLILKLILILYESLGEVYPDVLGSILNALYLCILCMEEAAIYSMSNPSLNQLLPTLSPIMRNRQEKVQEACIKLVGLIATKNAETINAKEWMRICFELLDMLKSQKKKIRVAANETFGHISKTIGPQDIIVMLLNNLRVQERQLRVCTAVAIGIVAETCGPFTVLPALMNEYRTPDNNVQNGVLKALSFLFEYIDGNMTKDYLYAITPLLEDALTDRDQVHRQTAASVVKHMALNCIGRTNDGYYDVFMHLLNLIVPNVLESSPHVIIRVLESMDALRCVLGVGSFANYIWAGLYHPARKVREPYWKLYNSAYMQNRDALVPYYPSLNNIEGYEIPELNITI